MTSTLLFVAFALLMLAGVPIAAAADRARGRAGPGLDGHVIPEGTQLFDGLGCRRDPALAGSGLLGHNDAHGLPSSDGLASERTYRHRPALTYPM